MIVSSISNWIYHPMMQMMQVDANDAIWTNGISRLISFKTIFSPNRSGLEYRESRGNRAGDGIRAAGAGAGRDRAGTFPAEGYSWEK